MRIAVVGAGISGLTAAYYLSRVHEVDLLERNDYAGGHTRTVRAGCGAESISLDMGFMVYNDASYPGFSSLLRDLDVQTQPSDMSFGVSCASCAVEYSSRGLGGIFARPSNAFRPSTLRLGLDILRFYRDAVPSMTDPSLREATLVSYLQRRRYSDTFRRHFVVPLLAAVWSTPPSLVDVFPAQYFLRFIHNHGLVGGRDFRWRTVAGGAGSYVERLLCASNVRCFVNTPVRSIRRDPFTVALTLESCERREYDAVVLACHADEALDLLEDASHEETEALSSITYLPNRVVLHSDSSVLPRARGARASWNYTTRDCRAPMEALTLSYDLNRIQALPGGRRYCVTVNPERPIPDEALIAESSFSHPRYTFRTLEGQRLLSGMNGERHTFFAGAYMGYGFHEDGFVSGRRVATLLGVVD